MPARLCAAVLLTGLCSRWTVGAEGVESRLVFRDAITGAAVQPEVVLLDGAPVDDPFDPRGHIMLRSAAGDHALHVHARGYRALKARHHVAADGTPDTLIWLDPRQPPPEYERNLSNGEPHAGFAVLTGYVNDASTGSALEGARVSLAEAELTTTTDPAGYFLLEVPVRGGRSAPGAGGDTAFDLERLTVARPGFVTHEVRDVLLSAGLSRHYALRLEPGNVTPSRSEASVRGELQAQLIEGAVPESGPAAPPVEQPDAAEPAPRAEGASVAPTSIRVGRNCSCTSCPTVETMSMDTYVKRVLPAEWFPSWHSESLKAGAVAIRSYGGWYVEHPISASYDICDTTCCQAYGGSPTTTTNAAVDATAGLFMVDSAGQIARAEYSAENNGGSCADCYTVNRPNDGVCLHDPVCCGFTFNGHGRGMCQWGTQRWATQQAQTFEWMCDHYYAAYNWTLTNLAIPPNPATILSDPSPQSICPGGTALFSVLASGDEPLTYRWQKNNVDLSEGGHYSGTATDVLTISDADAADEASYRCRVTNAGSSDTSNTALLSLDGPPFAPCDLDLDGDCDQADFGRFQACFTGPNIPQDDPACLVARLDLDADVDPDDFNLFLACMTGAAEPADPCCPD